jgi:CDP-glucose 4,6-dehydratase
MPYEIIDQSSFHEAGLLKLDCTKAKELLSWEASLNFEQTAYFTSKWYSSYESADVHDLTRDQIENYCNIASNKGLLWTK